MGLAAVIATLLTAILNGFKLVHARFCKQASTLSPDSNDEHNEIQLSCDFCEALLTTDKQYKI